MMFVLASVATTEQQPPYGFGQQPINGKLLCEGHMNGGSGVISFTATVDGNDNSASMSVTPRSGSSWPAEPFIAEKLDGIVWLRQDKSLLYWVPGKVALRGKSYDFSISFPLTQPSNDPSEFEILDSDKINQSYASMSERARVITTLRCANYKGEESPK